MPEQEKKSIVVEPPWVPLSKKSVVVRSICSCVEIKHTVIENEWGWFELPNSICSECHKEIVHQIHEDDTPNPKE